ncbi:MAG: hypothetical protein ACTHLE_26025 [Agriterribacter sp.]
MKTVLRKLDQTLAKPLRKWVNQFFNKRNDDDPFGNNPCIIL